MGLGDSWMGLGESDFNTEQWHKSRYYEWDFFQAFDK